MSGRCTILATDVREKHNLVTWQDGLPVLNKLGEVNPSAKEMLPRLYALLIKKLRAAGYPDAFLPVDPDSNAKRAGA